MRACALILVTALVVSACGTGATAMAQSDVPRSPAETDQVHVGSAVAAMDTFASDLYAGLASGDQNLVFSPASIFIALAMTYAGAEGATAEEMARTLHIDLDDETFHEAMNTLDLALESRSFRKDDEGVLLSIANSLWAQQDTTFEQPFLDTLAADYGAGVRLVDFKTAAEKARVRINEWVADETNDKITDLIPKGALDELVRLVLVNAVYLDATWAQQFDPNDTTDRAFHRLGGDTVTVPMMHQVGSFPYGAGDGWQAVQMPYLGGDLAMLVIVPEDGRFDEIEATLGEGLLEHAITSPVAGTRVSLTMPKFETRTQAGLTPVLGALGMSTAFDRNLADFSRMTTEEQLFIGDVIHEAYIAVDEEGTEAAAATAVIIRATSAPLIDVELTLDRPFIFAIRDSQTGAVLFLGRIMDPRSST